MTFYGVRWNIKMLVLSEIRLRDIRYPRWIRKNKVAIEDILKTVNQLFRARAYNNVIWVNFILGVFLIPRGNILSKRW